MHRKCGHLKMLLLFQAYLPALFLKFQQAFRLTHLKLLLFFLLYHDELGPTDIEANQCVVVRRDTREKTVVALDELNEKLAEILETMQSDMLARAKAFLNDHICDAKNYADFMQKAETRTGFIRGMWCEDLACELKIKEDTGVTSRCMPFNDQEQISDVCVCCGKPAHKLVYWGKAY